MDLAVDKRVNLPKVMNLFRVEAVTIGPLDTIKAWLLLGMFTSMVAKGLISRFLECKSGDERCVFCFPIHQTRSTVSVAAVFVFNARFPYKLHTTRILSSFFLLSYKVFLV